MIKFLCDKSSWKMKSCNFQLLHLDGVKAKMKLVLPEKTILECKLQLVGLVGMQINRNVITLEFSTRVLCINGRFH